MGLLEEGEEPDRNTIARLQKHDRIIVMATNRNLNASLEEVGFLPKM